MLRVVQSDGRIKKWAKISDVNKYLRVMVLEDGETVHNAFFDRTFRVENGESQIFFRYRHWPC